MRTGRLVLVVGLLGVWGSLRAQLPEAPLPAQHAPQPDGAAGATTQHKEESEQILRSEERQRLLGVVPNFTVVYEGQVVPPLTARQKFSLALHTTTDPFTIGYAFLVGGGFSEVTGSHAGFGWGPGGYFKRAGASYADAVNGAMIGNALLPVVLHQDPRYFRMGHGPFGRRFVHAALSTVVCRGDNGHTEVNVSNVLGNYLSGAIANSYYPPNERGVALTLETGTTVTLYGTVGGEFLEFAPDGIAYLKRHHHRRATP